jgi:tRNA-2-methylthio-N6-dimethylallyladenosine synthase
MVTGTSKKNDQMLSGRTENMHWVHFEGPDALINQFIEVLITEARPNSLRGRWLDTEPRRAVG